LQCFGDCLGWAHHQLFCLCSVFGVTNVSLSKHHDSCPFPLITMVVVDRSISPATFVHDRRVEQAEKQKGMASKADSCWCTCANSKCLNASVLADVDLAWLEVHNGRFMHHMHTRSSSHRATLHLKKHKLKSSNEVAEEVLRVRHTVIGVCPRFFSQKMSSAYFDNQDKWLGLLWNFLAIIGLHANFAD
jgi:hypothetical protein